MMALERIIITVGSDARTESVLEFVKYLPRLLVKPGFLYIPESKQEYQWPDVGRKIAEEVVNKQAKFGVVMCDSGTGVCIAANRVPGARAVFSPDKQVALLGRYWNDANILAMSHTYPVNRMIEIASVFFTTEMAPKSQYVVDMLESA
jgi:ribose 5-phosphate isomerase B